MMLNQKRGQSTIFIIAGIAIVVIIGLVVFFTRTDVQVGRRITTTQVEPIKEFVESCVRKELLIDLELIRSNSGFFGPVSLIRPLGNVNNPVYINYVLFGTLWRLPTIDNIQFQLANRVKDKLKSEECSLDGFMDNFEIKNDLSKMNVDVVLNNKNTVVNIYYPIKIEKDGVVIDLNEFIVEEEDDIGALYRFVSFIVQKELNEGFSFGQLDSEDFRNNVGDINLFDTPEYNCEDKNFCVGSIGTKEEREKERLAFATCVGVKCDAILDHDEKINCCFYNPEYFV